MTIPIAELRELLRLADENEKLKAALKACLELDSFYDDRLNVQGEIMSICHTHGIDPEEL